VAVGTAATDSATAAARIRGGGSGLMGKLVELVQVGLGSDVV
jgi:hypothetical protein